MNEHVITFASGVIVGALVSLVGHFFSIQRDKRREHNESAIKFRAAFLPEIRKIKYLIDYDQNCEAYTINILQKAYDRHHSAKLLFEIRLSRSERYAFNKAWDEYTQKETVQKWSDHIGVQLFIGYGGEHNCDKEKESRRLALERIHRLLSFAHEK
jgi:hypothetical protein